MNPEPNLQFSLGPVQGFISQARRTRDLWSGSYILSYLSARAMKGIIENDGKIVLPKVWDDEHRDHLLCWVMENRSGDPPRIGTIPNRFQAWADRPEEAARAAEKQIREAWKDIESAVWKRFLSRISIYGNGTQEIWNRQVKDFWEIYWTVGNIPEMEARKNWRTRATWNNELPEPEGGDHCTIMGDWQELSGFERTRDSVKQNRFWEKLREVKEVGRLDLREDERLCSIAMIKRMFPDVAKEAIDWEVNAKKWPSTMYVAALPWLREIEKYQITQAQSYARLVLESADRESVRRDGIWKHVGGRDNPDLAEFLELDGNFYFISELRNSRHTPLRGSPSSWTKEESAEVKEARSKLITNLNLLNASLGREPSPFYGMLHLDGDHMGKLLSEYGQDVAQAVSLGVASFASKVDSIIKVHGGITVYAGGEDVMAMLPVTNSIACAASLAKCYKDAFESTFKRMGLSIPDSEGTISAGLVLANGRYPLRSVLQEVHHLLDRVAKDRNGRDSLAVSVLKGSGKYCQWVTTWQALECGESTILDVLAEALAGEARHFSASFFFRFREILMLLSPQPYWEPGSYIKLTEEFDEDDIKDLLTAEYLKSRSGEIDENRGSIEDARRWVGKLLAANYCHYRNKAVECGSIDRCLGADAAMLVKFLSQGGMED